MENVYSDQPVAQQLEQTFDILRHDKIIDGGETLANIDFFGQGSENGTRYQNFILNTGNRDHAYKIKGMAFVHHSKFDVTPDTNTGLEKNYDDYFHKNAYIQFEFLNKGYAKIPLWLLMGNTYYSDAGTPVVREKFNDWFKPGDEYILHPTRTTKCTLYIPTALITTATGVAFRPGVTWKTLSNNLGHSFELLLYVEVIRGIK